MEKNKVIRKQVKNIVKGVCILAYGTAAIVGAFLTRDSKQSNETKHYVSDATYSDTVNVIVNSSMLESSKKRAIEMLKSDGNAEYYNAVIATVNSDMLDSNKIAAIELIFKK